MQIPNEFKVYFWDVSVNAIDLTKHSSFVIARILNEGNHKALVWLFKTYDEHTIEHTVRTARNLSIKTTRCWNNYFNLEERELCCIGLHSK